MSEEKFKGQTKRIWYQRGVKDERERIRELLHKAIHSESPFADIDALYLDLKVR